MWDENSNINDSLDLTLRGSLAYLSLFIQLIFLVSAARCTLLNEKISDMDFYSNMIPIGMDQCSKVCEHTFSGYK